MMNKLKYLLFFTFLFSLNSSAQPNHCDGILIPDVTQKNNEYNWAQTIVNIFQSNHIETYDDYKKFMGNATIPIEGIPWSFGSNITADNFKEFKDDLFKYSSLSAEGRTKINETIHSLSNAAIHAWESCQNSLGFHFWVLQGADPKTFTLSATYRGQGVAHIRTVSFSAPVTTGRNGSFADSRLKTNSSFEWGDGIQYQTFTRTTDEPLNIDINPKEQRVGDGLHIQLSQAGLSAPVIGILISDGDINENAEATSTWTRPDQSPAFHKSWHKLPYDAGPHLDNDAAFAQTTAETSILISTDRQYKWLLYIRNLCGGSSGPNGTGGAGYAAPSYRTTLNLPTAKRNILYTVYLQGSCRADKNEEGVGKDAIVTLGSIDITRKLSFKVDLEYKNSNLEIKDLKPGIYTIDLQLPKVGGGSSGVSLNGDPTQIHKLITYQTNFTVEVKPQYTPR